MQVGQTDFNPVLTAIAAGEPEFLYYPIFVAEGGLITQQARQTPGLEATLFAGSDGMFTPDWIEAAGADNAEGVYISGPDLTALSGDMAFYTDTFIPAYTEKYGAPQSVFHAHAWDATNMILAAIEAGGNRSGRHLLHPQDRPEGCSLRHLWHGGHHWNARLQRERRLPAVGHDRSGHR